MHQLSYITSVHKIIFKFSAAECGPGQVTNDVTLSMDMTLDMKVNIPFGPKQRQRRHHIHHDSMSGWVVAGCRSIPPDSFQTLGLLLLTTRQQQQRSNGRSHTLWDGSKTAAEGEIESATMKRTQCEPCKTDWNLH